MSGQTFTESVSPPICFTQLLFVNTHVQIAQELDAMERALLGGSSEAGEHGNVDASGMFSVQTLSTVSLWGCKHENLNTRFARIRPSVKKCDC
eukprot:scaffold7505_cov18-Tisochrysis_lutea.AAC.1